MDKTQSLPSEGLLPAGANGPEKHVKRASTERDELRVCHRVKASTLSPAACLQTTAEEPHHSLLKALPSRLETLRDLATCPNTPQTPAPQPCQALCPQGAPWHLPLSGPKDCPPGLLLGWLLLLIPSPHQESPAFVFVTSLRVCHASVRRALSCLTAGLPHQPGATVNKHELNKRMNAYL